MPLSEANRTSISPRVINCAEIIELNEYKLYAFNSLLSKKNPRQDNFTFYKER